MLVYLHTAKQDLVKVIVSSVTEKTKESFQDVATNFLRESKKVN
jgi:hypothetical protein